MLFGNVRIIEEQLLQPLYILIYIYIYIYIYIIELFGYADNYYESYCLLRKSSHSNTQTFTWLVLLLVKTSVGYGKVASGSAILHGNSILKGFQEIEYYMQ